MAELLLHVGQRLAPLDQQGRVGVAKVVEADPPQPGLVEQRVPDAMQEIQRVDWLAGLVRVYPWGRIAALEGSLGLQEGLPGLERTRQRRRKVHAASFSALRASGAQRAAGVGHSPTDVDEAARKIEVLPLEPQDLALTEPSPRRGRDQIEPGRIPAFAGGEQMAELALGEWHHAGARLLLRAPAIEAAQPGRGV